MIDTSNSAKAKRLRFMADETRATRQEWADIAKCSPQAIQGWLKTGTGSDARWKKIADHYKFNFTWLITGKGSPTPSDELKVQEPAAAYGFQKQIDGFHDFAATMFGDAGKIPMLQDIMHQALRLWLMQSPANQDVMAQYLAESFAKSTKLSPKDTLPMMRQAVRDALVKYDEDHQTYSPQDLDRIKAQAIEDYLDEARADAHAELADDDGL